MALVRRAASAPSAEVRLVDHEVVMDRLRANNLLKTPIDIYSIAEFLGLEVQEEAMDDEMSGYIEPRGSAWTIGVNSYHHPNRQRFTIAHELGHFLLHRPREKHTDVTFARRSGQRNTVENQADSFAAQLLMPEAEVRKLIADGETSLERLAAHFQVSAMAAKFRAETLGYKVR